MRTKTTLSTHLAACLPAFALLGAGATFWACTAEFRTECPEGTTQTAGGGDVGEACTPNDQLGGAGGAAGAGGSAGGAPTMGSGGTAPVPPGGVCSPEATKCQGDAQQTCGADGQWGAAKACDINCDAAGSKCVVPVQLAAGSEFTCALLSDATVRCWGANIRGTLGLGAADETANRLKPAVVPGLGNVKKLAAEDNNVCALMVDGSAYCWGENNGGVIGDAANSPAPFFSSPYLLPEKNLADFDVSISHWCATKSGKLYCRGQNGYGQIGDGTTGVHQNALTEVINFPGTLAYFETIFYSTCAASESGDVFCWGYGPNSALGQLESSDNSSTPLKVKGNLGKVVKISAGVGRTICTLNDEGTVSCWGYNYHGQLGRGIATAVSEDVPSSSGRAEFVANLSGVQDIAVGGYHSCALKQDGNLWCWGFNNQGQLANDCSTAPCQSTNDGAISASPMRVPLENIRHVAAGSFHTCATTNDDVAYCWGRNDKGQLGNGEVSAVGAGTPTPTRVLWK